MVPASCSTEIAQPRSVRVAGRLSFVISIELAPTWDESFAPLPFRDACNPGGASAKLASATITLGAC
jgi:hypothetical protein